MIEIKIGLKYALILSFFGRQSLGKAVSNENTQAKRSALETTITNQTIGPLYNPLLWPKTINVTNEPGTYIDCNMFPDDNGVTLQHDDLSPWNEVFCWLNNTFRHPEGETFLRTTNNCYFSEHVVKAGSDGTPEHDFTHELPWCGPIRPYFVDYENNDWIFRDYDGTEKYSLPCWRSPTNESAMVQTDIYYPHLYCWVEGQMVNKTNRWYENAHLAGGKKCYLPADMLELAVEGKPMYSMPGSGEACPKEE